MPKAAAFNRILVSAFVLYAVALTCYAQALQLQPHEGDLAGLGGYSERDYGWNGSQPSFPNKDFDTEEELKKPYDVVVIGDSFSHLRPQFLWQHEFCRRTGLSLVTLPQTLISDDGLKAWLEGPAFRRYPPRLLIVESVERYLVPRFRGKLPNVPEPGPVPPIPAVERVEATVPSSRDVTPTAHGFAWLDAKNHFTVNTLRWLGDETTNVVKVPLSRSDRFTSRRADELLYFGMDNDKRSKPPGSEEAIAHDLLMLQRLAESNGRTHMAYAMAPDKETVYDDDLARPQDRLPNIIAGVARQPGLHFIRLDLPLRERVLAGDKDVYLPNDTHWGGAGHLAAGRAIVLALKKDGVLRYSEKSSGPGL